VDDEQKEWMGEGVASGGPLLSAVSFMWERDG
jgi:hypothetical protein